MAVDTRDVRVVVRLELGLENPVTLVEELNVLDNISGGRAVALFAASDVPEDRLREELQVCVLAGSQRPFTFDGTWWRVPGRLPEHQAPEWLLVTPPPTQLVVPLWSEHGLPRVDRVTPVAQVPERVGTGPVAPVELQLTGDLEQDRAAAARCRDAGATHCLVTLPCGTSREQAFADLVRYVVPDSAMVAFPRVVAEVDLPAPWPRSTPDKENADD
ncbi:hypothetical protein GCM10027062_24270 [Nocardioides hungaricus]